MRRLILSEVSKYTSRGKNDTKIWASSLNFSKSHLASLQVLCFNNSRWMEEKSFSWSNLEWNTILQMSRLSNSTTEQSMSSSPVTHHLKNNDVLHIFHIRSTKLSRSIFPLTTLIPLRLFSSTFSSSSLRPYILLTNAIQENYYKWYVVTIYLYTSIHETKLNQRARF